MIKGLHHISMKCATKEEFEKAKSFYLDLLGFSIVRQWPQGIMIDLGNTQLEIFCNGNGVKDLGAIRHMAFATDDVEEIVAKVKDAGYEVFIEPKDIVIDSDPEFHARMAFCFGPLGEQIEFFKEC
ncbi:MAG: VOC family protein [Clostridiales bacterium]|nr:VOC family protein [Clostridiales bacterium]